MDFPSYKRSLNCRYVWALWSWSIQNETFRTQRPLMVTSRFSLSLSLSHFSINFTEATSKLMLFNKLKLQPTQEAWSRIQLALLGMGWPSSHYALRGMWRRLISLDANSTCFFFCIIVQSNWASINWFYVVQVVGVG